MGECCCNVKLTGLTVGCCRWKLLIRISPAMPDMPLNELYQVPQVQALISLSPRVVSLSHRLPLIGVSLSVCLFVFVGLIGCMLVACLPVCFVVFGFLFMQSCYNNATVLCHPVT